jgi:hypothetical protein
LILFSGRNLRLNLNILPLLILFSGRNLRLNIFFLNLPPQSILSSSLLRGDVADLLPFRRSLY